VIDLLKIGIEINEWSIRNFGKQISVLPLLGVMEELGELTHCHLNTEQGIRGTSGEHEINGQDAVGDLMVYLLNYCHIKGWNIEEILEKTWGEVKRRDWVKYPKTGFPPE